MEGKAEIPEWYHDGHRERMREKLLEIGADGFSPVDMLEVVLFLVIPRADTKNIAKALLNRFGTFSGVINASVNELIKIKGIGKSAAEFLHMLPPISRYYIEDLTRTKKRIFDINSAYEQIKSKFIGRTQEIVVAMILNSRGVIKFNNIVSYGSISQVPIYVRQLIQLCLEYEADTIILAHNHTSGNPAPSRGDIVATKELQLALDAIYVNLEDHMIFTETDYMSMKKSGWLSDISMATSEFRKNMVIGALKAEREINL